MSLLRSGRARRSRKPSGRNRRVPRISSRAVPWSPSRRDPRTAGARLCVWLAPCTQSIITAEIPFVKALFGEFEGSESEVGRTDEFRGPRDAGYRVSTSLSSGIEKSNRGRLAFARFRLWSESPCGARSRSINQYAVASRVQRSGSGARAADERLTDAILTPPGAVRAHLMNNVRQSCSSPAISDGALIPAVPVPFDADGRIDPTAQGRYAEWMARQPVDGVAVWAHTGRGLRLDADQRAVVLRCLARGTGPSRFVIAAAGAAPAACRSRRSDHLGAGDGRSSAPNSVPMPCWSILPWPFAIEPIGMHSSSTITAQSPRPVCR